MEEWWGVPTDRGDALRSPDRRIDKKISLQGRQYGASRHERAMER